MPLPTIGVEAFRIRRDELRRGRQYHTPLELPAEYQKLTEHIRQSWISCGEDHARGVAYGFGRDFGWHRDDLMRGASARMVGR